MLLQFLIEMGVSKQEISFIEKLAKSVGIELNVIESPLQSGSYLKIGEGGVSYYCCGAEGPALTLDFVSEYAGFMRQVSKTAAGPLKKALGRAVKKGDTVVDATCGTGKDSLLFLSWGLKVLAYERHPLMFVLLQTAWQKFIGTYPELVDKFELVFGDVRGGVEKMRQKNISVLYFDPMFSEGPGRRRSLPRQEMVVFGHLVGADLDQECVIQSLLELPLNRIVVKRPAKAAQFAAPAPLATFQGKSVRYDLFRGR
ncbi:MAG: class I SAM-dependent methyltransferase [Bdellovibrio sp.]|nr:class I SAM-dependent methyltransferase [Bdellovibrio sp.]